MCDEHYTTLLWVVLPLRYSQKLGYNTDGAEDYLSLFCRLLPSQSSNKAYETWLNHAAQPINFWRMPDSQRHKQLEL